MTPVTSEQSAEIHRLNAEGLSRNESGGGDEKAIEAKTAEALNTGQAPATPEK